MADSMGEIAAVLIKELKLEKARVEGEELHARCPNPQHEDRKPSFSINLNSYFYNCWSCGFSGRGLAGLYLKMGKNVPDWVRDMPTRTSRKTGKPTAPKNKHEFAARNSWLSWLSADPAGAYQKWKPRGIKLETIKKFGIGYNSKHDIIYCPCINGGGQLVGWGERSDNWEHRWKVMPEGVVKAQLIFGENHIKEGFKNNVYVVEGVVDALKLWQWGFKAVAVMGNHMYKDQADRLIDIAQQVIIIPDNDKPGLTLRYDAVKHLKGKVPLSGVNLPKGIKDVGQNECTLEIIKTAIKQRIKI